MDRWLNGAPALAYVKELGIWVVLNNNGKIMVWTADAAEVDWLSLWLLEYKKKDGLEDHVECRWSQAKSCFYTPKKAATAMESRRFRKQKFG